MSKVKIVAVLFSLSLLSVGCGHVEETVLSGLMTSYLSAQEALAADDLTSATMALQAVSDQAEGPLKDLALKAAKETDIEMVRKQFIEVSAEVQKVEVPEGTVVAFCPMANDGEGASWVQREGDIANPYFGEKMLRCGTVEEGKKN